jgi:hypothetical protein
MLWHVASIMTNERKNESQNFRKSVTLKLETCIMHLEQTEIYESAQHQQCDLYYILEAEHCFPLKEVRSARNLCLVLSCLVRSVRKAQYRDCDVLAV